MSARRKFALLLAAVPVVVWAAAQVLYGIASLISAVIW